MKLQWLLLSAVCILLVGSAVAQTDFSQKMTAKVPFDFLVNGAAFPKGEYLVSETSDGRKLLITNKSEPQYSTFVLNTNRPLAPGKIHTDGKIVFARNNGQHVLHQICFTADSHTNDIVHGSDVVELVATR